LYNWKETDIKNMRMIRNKLNYLTICFLLFMPAVSYSQGSFLAGTSQVSIEPDQSLLSLHLGGYGAPREGRFTLQWIYRGTVPEIKAMTGCEERLFIISGNSLLWSDPFQNNPSWKKAGSAENITCIGNLNGKLYAVTVNGELLEAKANPTAKWKKTGKIDKPVTSIAGTNNNLFATDDKGSLWSRDISSDNNDWIRHEAVRNIVSITANNGKLYALTSDRVIFQNEPGKNINKWLKMAYKNGQTIKEDIKQVALVENRLFGVSREGMLFIGEHRSEGNLTARALAIGNAEKRVVIVNVDVCGLNDSFTGMVKQEILRRINLSPSAVFINSSHTHFAPVSQNWLTWQEANQRPDTVFLYTIVKNGILKAVEGAVSSMAPADLYFGRGKTDIGYNRSLRDHPELYDDAVDVLKIAYTGKSMESYLFLTACHPVFSTAGKLHYTISANYPGVARKLVEERTGTANSLFLQGTAGDINPRDNGEYISGEKLANEVIAVLGRPMTRIEGGISFFLDTINIPVTPWPKDEIIKFRAQNSDKPGNVDAEKNVKWCDLMMSYYNENKMPSSLPVYVQTLNIGNWKLVGFSRETTTGYGFGVKNLWPDKLISVAGYTNDVSSYLPTHMHIEKRGYEGLNSFFWYGMPNVFPMSVDETILGTIKTLGR
jgi:hypothetical protein